MATFGENFPRASKIFTSKEKETTMDNRIGEARREFADRNDGRFTQEDAAEFFGVSLSTYQKWEQGQGMLNGAQLREIAEKYGVTVDYLLMVDAPQSPGGYTAVERAIIEKYRALSEDDKAVLYGILEILGRK